jgi:hypothetical protein
VPTVDQHLRAVARSRPDTPFWVLEKDYALLAALLLDAGESEERKENGVSKVET